MPRSFLIAVLCASFAIETTASVCAVEITTDNAESAGREAFRRSGRYPWYDAKADDLRDIEERKKTVDDTDTRKKGWESKPKAPSSWNWNWWNWGWSGTWIPSFMQGLGMFVLAALLITLVVLLVRYFMSAEGDEGSSEGSLSFSDEADEAERIENLPFQIAGVGGGDFLSRATRCRDEGRYNEAIVFLYSYLLVQLDKYQHIHLAKGKTNRRYLREVNSRPDLQAILRRTMIAFEDVFFGRHDLPREEFHACWDSLEEFTRALDAEGVAA